MTYQVHAWKFHRRHQYQSWDIVAYAEYKEDAMQYAMSLDVPVQVFEAEGDAAKKLIFDNSVGKDLRT